MSREIDGSKLLLAGLRGKNLMSPSGALCGRLALEQAVAIALDMQPDVVFLDLGMPRLDGVGAGRKMLQVLAERPVLIALTGWGSPSTAFDPGQASITTWSSPSSPASSLNYWPTAAIAAARP